MTISRRVQLGQWFTPEDVADLAVELAFFHAAIPGPSIPSGPKTTLRFLDPACGDGAFLASLHRRGVPVSQMQGIDIDETACKAAKSSLAGADILRDDFLRSDKPGKKIQMVLGNPPYIRQERVAKDIKEIVSRSLTQWAGHASPSTLAAIGKSGDIAAAFLLKSLSWLEPGGFLCFVVSQGMFVNAHAQPLWKAILPIARPVIILSAPSEKWFEDAFVNTAIVVLEKLAPESRQKTSRPRPKIPVARLSMPTKAAVKELQLKKSLASIATVQMVSSDDPRQWGQTLRTSQVWQEFVRAAKERLVPLSSLVEVRRGITSGANELFYMERAQAQSLGIEEEVLTPLLPPPKYAAFRTITLDHTPFVAITVPGEKNALEKYPNAKSYFLEHQDEAQRKTLAAKPFWWSLTPRPAKLFLTKAYDAKFVQRYASTAMAADQRVYTLQPKQGVDIRGVAGVLNCTMGAFALESLGRGVMGHGALEWTVGDAKTLPVLDPRSLSKKQLDQFEEFFSQPVGTVFEEAENPKRRQFDLEILGSDWTGPPLLDIHEALLASVRQRTGRYPAERTL